MRKISTFWLMLVCLAGMMGTWAASSRGENEDGAAKPAAPFGIAARIPFTTSKVIGSPEPPLPYTTKPAFEKLKFDHPVYVTELPGGSRILVAEVDGKIQAFPNNPDVEEKDVEIFFELTEHQLYSLTFHPKFAENGYVYLFTNGPKKPNEGEQKKDRILRYNVTAEEPRKIIPDSLAVIIEWASNGHNGGEMAFGKDGLLYISSGDGTSDSDGDITGQDITDLASGVIRIDVEHPDEGKGYSVPKDNPFLNIPDARPELWAYGFRNPWRLTIDPKNGDIWVGDIGQDLWEMITLVEKGGNYGWSVYEGTHPFYLERKVGPTPVTKPLIEHPHSEARSITGGIVYQGTRFPELTGAYIYGDYATGKIWGARQSGGKVTWHQELADTPFQILGFGQDQQGEIYFVDYGGKLDQLIPMPPATETPEFPRTLSETGLFESVPDHRPQPGLIPYSVNSPLWSDGAYKERFMAIPGTEPIKYTEKGPWKFPEKTVLVKSFSLETEAGNPESRKRVETRLMVLQQGEWVGYSYQWNDEQTDATLVETAGKSVAFEITDTTLPAGKRTQSWLFPSRVECMVCHSRAAGYVLGPRTPQMNRSHDYGGVTDNQLRALAHIDAIKLPDTPIDELPRYPDPYDGNADIEQRARAYLDTNCAICHVGAGGGNAAMVLSFQTELDKAKIVDEEPLHHRFNMTDAKLVKPGDPAKSLLLYRISHREAGRMPPLATSLVDEEAVSLFRDWIQQLKLPEKPEDKPTEKE